MNAHVQGCGEAFEASSSYLSQGWGLLCHVLLGEFLSSEPSGSPCSAVWIPGCLETLQSPSCCHSVQGFPLLSPQTHFVIFQRTGCLDGPCLSIQQTHKHINRLCNFSTKKLETFYHIPGGHAPLSSSTPATSDSSVG